MKTKWQDLLKQYHVAKAAAGVDLSSVAPESLPAHKLRKGMAAEMAEEMKRRISDEIAQASFAIFLPPRLMPNRVKRFAQLAPGVDGAVVVLDSLQVYRELSSACAGAVQTRTLTPQNVQDLSVASAELAQQLNVQPFFFPGARHVHAPVENAEQLVSHVRDSIRDTNQGALNGAFLQREVVRQVLEVEEERDDQPVVCLVLNATDEEAKELAQYFGRGSYVVDELPARDKISDKTVVEVFEKARHNLK
jgi:hypothetical protein